MILYYHPLSSYCWKVLIAFYENGAPFAGRMLEDGEVAQEWMALWPIGKFPLLHDPARNATIGEASVIIEYLAQHEAGTFRPIPADPDAALEVRLMDRLFDNYVMAPMQAIVADRLRPEEQRDSLGVTQARDLLAKAYALIEARMAGRRWAVGEAFTLADCAAAPALFYVDRIVPLTPDFPGLAAYLARLGARPSVARVLEEKQPWWHLFPFADG
ncbi:glutathione S-transferase family protein [Sphingomonas bisphenolicum]|uniref:Glutathione S-transferase n=1 Tax=Sphingomonas bisphenolicum TaxID=296544 RepID=A0ABN5W9I0_9SPHN|nr:glutathione S-transferase family protein [Sphingomonas bisphenolicum]BBF68580.1 glutathione S-transferase [Sphingomonas bisphenolicum]